MSQIPFNPWKPLALVLSVILAMSVCLHAMMTVYWADYNVPYLVSALGAFGKSKREVQRILGEPVRTFSPEDYQKDHVMTLFRFDSGTVVPPNGTDGLMFIQKKRVMFAFFDSKGTCVSIQTGTNY